MRLYLKIALSLFICSYMPFCAMAQEADVAVIEKAEPAPQGAKMLGKIKIGDGVFKTDCSYETVVGEAKEKARKAGANIVKITEVKEPDGWSSCYRIKADIYYAADISGYIALQQHKDDSVSGSLLPDTASYALVYIYRPRSGVGALVSYIMHQDDSAIGRVRNNTGFIVRVPNTGKVKLWARTESRAEVSVNVVRGHVYFLRCSIKMGVLVGEPKLELVSPPTGVREFKNVRVRQATEPDTE